MNHTLESLALEFTTQYDLRMATSDDVYHDALHAWLRFTPSYEDEDSLMMVEQALERGDYDTIPAYYMKMINLMPESQRLKNHYLETFK